MLMAGNYVARSTIKYEYLARFYEITPSFFQELLLGRSACFGESRMPSKPFVELASPRVVGRPELPPDLAEFYAQYEGVGLESDPDRTVRLCQLMEVTRIGWMDLHIVAPGDVPEGWEGFAAIRMGMGMFFEELVYVIDAPSCPPRSILAIGGLAPGPGGSGPYALESTLVLAATFQDWLSHLEAWGWVEYAVAGIGDLSDGQQQELLQYYLRLNPGMNVGREGSG